MKIKTKIFLIFFTLTFTLCSIISYIFYRNAYSEKFNDLRSNITSIANSATLLIDEAKHSKLNSEADMVSAEYLDLRTKLKNFRDCYPQIRHMYTMVKTPTNNIWKFIIDTDDPKDEDNDGIISESENITPIGEEYNVAPYKEMKLAFEGPIADKELTPDKWGIWLSAYAPIYSKNGIPTAIVGVDVSAKTINEEKHKLRKRILMIFGISIFLSFLISLYLSNSVTKPLLRVIKTTKLISEGKYDTFIQETRKDEIGDLIFAINEMSKYIKKTIDKLTTLHRTGEILALTIDLMESLRLSMNLSMEILGASKGLILLYHKSTGNISLGTTSGLESVKVLNNELFVEFERLNLKPNTDFISFISSKPEIYSFEDAETIPQLSQAKEWMRKTHTTAFMPFVIKQELRGFILLNIQINDKAFLKTIVNQIGMSIENARLYHEAVVDGLTGLYVHRYFEIQLSTEIKRAQRFGKNLSVLMIDIDHFKKFNDIHGHQAGDFVLKEVSSVIQDTARTVDIVSRYGGEEISLILPETDIYGAKVIAEKIRKTIEEREFIYQNDNLRVTVSIGAASFDKTLPISPEKLISMADQALYIAKQAGRNRVETYGKTNV
ncbi:MAG: Response regulator PleD [Elusimicrobia bacterium ADurb.Bin231]|nr:MAG: Response regulator PleD [Elusimicrobia bacterium ADurb.Bin231]